MWKVAEFGKIIGVAPSTLRRWESEGKLIPQRTRLESAHLHRSPLINCQKP